MTSQTALMALRAVEAEEGAPDLSQRRALLSQYLYRLIYIAVGFFERFFTIHDAG